MNLPDQSNLLLNLMIFSNIIFYITASTFFLYKWREKIKRNLTLFKLTIERILTSKSNRDSLIKKLNEKNIIFTNRISVIIPEHFNKGSTIITSDGVGIITNTYYGPMYEGHKPESIGVMLRRKYYKHIKPNTCLQYAVYNSILKKFIPLSTGGYEYIIKKNQLVDYRITKRQYAELTGDYKKSQKHISIFNSKRGGRSILLHLMSEGYKITK